jgi:hypothetical protein
MTQYKDRDLGPEQDRERRGGAPPDRPRVDQEDSPAATSRDAEQRRQHRESPGSLDTGRKGGASEQTRDYQPAGRSSHK